MSIFAAFNKPFTLIRRPVGTWVDGDWVEGEATQIPSMGSIQPASEGDKRQVLNDTGKWPAGAIRVYTDDELNTVDTREGQQRQADRIIWNNRVYEVQSSNKRDVTALAHCKSIAVLLDEPVP